MNSARYETTVAWLGRDNFLSIPAPLVDASGPIRRKIRAEALRVHLF
jgi:hypothetical protein